MLKFDGFYVENYFFMYRMYIICGLKRVRRRTGWHGGRGNEGRNGTGTAGVKQGIMRSEGWMIV